MKRRPAAEASFEVVMMPLADIKRYERNPRNNLASIDKVADSIRSFGWRQPIVVAPDKVIIVGDTRYMAAQRLGLAKVPVHIARDLTPAQIAAYRLADNRTAEEADWDSELLAAELQHLRDKDFELALTGFAPIEIDELIAEALGGGRARNPDTVPPAPKKARTRLGDVWLLGKHRLRCGDARRIQDIQVATDNHLADVIWTDPPAAIAVPLPAGKPRRGQHRRDAATVNRDDALALLLLQVLRNLYKVCWDGTPIYLAHSDLAGLQARQAFQHAGFTLSSCLIWRKDSAGAGRADYLLQHEPILYGWKPGKTHPWFGGRKQTSFAELEQDVPCSELADGAWQISLPNRILQVRGNVTVEEWLPSVIDEPRGTRSSMHPDMKPTGLVERLLKNSARSGARVLDVFGGSGTTLIAAERLGMIASLVEINPSYCDVIVDRWQEYTGETAYREGEARPRKPRKKPKPARSPTAEVLKVKGTAMGKTQLPEPSAADAEGNLGELSPQDLEVP